MLQVNVSLNPAVPHCPYIAHTKGSKNDRLGTEFIRPLDQNFESNNHQDGGDRRKQSLQRKNERVERVEPADAIRSAQPVRWQ